MPDKTSNSPYSFSIAKQSERKLSYGWAKEASVKEFPISKNLAGVLMHLDPGGIRELHWHANAAEWGYVISGNVRTTIVDPQGRYEENVFGEGDIWYFPRGHGHSIQGLSPNGTTFMLVFDNGAFSEFATFSITDWLACTPKEIVAKGLRIREEDLKTLPDKEVYIVPGHERQESKLPDSPTLTHKYSLFSQKPYRECESGKLWLASSAEFPISATMTGAILELKPGGLREMHWHPNADEWIYIISGKVRLTEFASSGESAVCELSPGDIGYSPMGFGHSIENVGQDDCKIMVVFNSGVYEEISLSTWIASNPERLVADNLNLPVDVVRKLPKESVFISGKL